MEAIYPTDVDLGLTPAGKTLSAHASRKGVGEETPQDDVIYV